MGIIGLVGLPYAVLLPVFAAQLLHGDASTLALLMSGMGLSCLLSSVSLTVRQVARGLLPMILAGAALFGFGLMGLGLSRSLWLSTVTIIVVGFGMMQSISITNMTVQGVSHDVRRARVKSFYTMAYMGFLRSGA